MKRTYSDSDKAAALAALDANGGDVSHTARQLGVPRKTLSEWARGRGVSEDVPGMRAGKRGELTERLESVAHAILDALPGSLAGAQPHHLATALGIVLDKRQLLQGQPTAIGGDGVLSDDERAVRAAALLELARARRSGRGADGAGGAPAVPALAAAGVADLDVDVGSPARSPILA